MDLNLNQVSRHYKILQYITNEGKAESSDTSEGVSIPCIKNVSTNIGVLLESMAIR